VSPDSDALPDQLGVLQQHLLELGRRNLRGALREGSRSGRECCKRQYNGDGPAVVDAHD